MPTQTKRATVAELGKMLAPYVKAKLNRRRDERGYMIPRTDFVDIEYRGACRVDADIREVTSEGISSFFYSGCDLIRWEDVHAIVFRHDSGAELRFAPVARAEAA